MVWHAVMLLAMLFIRPRGLAGVPQHEGILAQVRDGIRYARGNETVFAILVISFTLSASAMSVIINLSPYWVLRVLDVSPTTWGLLAAIWGVGAVLTSYTLSGMGGFGNKGKIFLGSALVFSALFIAWGLVRSPVWFSVTQFFMAMCMSANFVSAGAIIQTLVPDEIRGRVLSLFGLNQAIALTTGIVVGGVAELAGATTVVPLIAMGLVAALACSALALPRLRNVD